MVKMFFVKQKIISNLDFQSRWNHQSQIKQKSRYFTYIHKQQVTGERSASDNTNSYDISIVNRFKEESICLLFGWIFVNKSLVCVVPFENHFELPWNRIHNGKQLHMSAVFFRRY